MSKLLLPLFLLFAMNAMAQTNWEDVMQQDNVRNFVGNLHTSGNDINQCINYAGEEHQLLALAIRMNATELQNHILKQEGLDLIHICDNKTIVQYAIQYGDVQTLKTLINAGANYKQLSTDGMSSLDFAKKLERTTAYGFLKSLN